MTTDDIDVPALMALRVQGLATPERLGSALGVSGAEALDRTRFLVLSELAAERPGNPRRFLLTSAGAEALGRALFEEGLAEDPELPECYEKGFLPLNEQLLRVASDWQVRRYGGAEIPNDHGDSRYDEEVIRRLRVLHDQATPVLRRMADRRQRFGPYRVRLTDCLKRVQHGDLTAFTAALAESYHTVWFELHQDLLLTLGIERED